MSEKLWGDTMDSETSCCSQDGNDSSQDIVASKIFDQCKIQECQSLGPAVSGEDCECVILPPCDESANLGRIILPGCPITAPQYTTDVKIPNENFSLSHVEITNICPSPLKKGYWSTDILFYFDFTLQFYGANRQPLKIVCCPTTLDELRNRKEKLFLKSEICYRKQIMLFGGEKPSTPVFSNLLGPTRKFNDPYLGVQAKACPVNETLKDPCCDESECCIPVCSSCCQCCNPCFDAYCEPFFYIFVETCLEAVIQLVRLTCREIQGKPCVEPQKCEHCLDDPHKLFEEMKFPSELFIPKN